MITNQTKVDGLGIVTTSNGDLCTNIKDLGRLISPRDDAYARAHSDIGGIEGTRVSMIVDYLKGELPVLVRDGMTKKLARNLFDANSKNIYYSTGSPGQYERARETADKEDKRGIAFEERKAIVCPSRNAFNMSPTENPNHLVFMFQDMAQKYFDKNGKRITFYPIDVNVVDGKQPELLSNPNGAIQNYLWFGGLNSSSVLYGDSGGANLCNVRARGVSDAPKAPQKTSGSLPYTQRQLSTTLNILERIQQGKVKISDLESEVGKVAEFLKNLKQ